jgi:ribosomal protein L29
MDPMVQALISYLLLLISTSMKTKDIINKTSSELNKLVADKREELRVARFGSAGAKIKNVKAASNIRRDIARILTTLTTIRNSTK